MSLPEPHPSRSDVELLQQFAANGSPQAFRELVDRYLPLVHASASRILRNSHHADDVAQSVFILLAQKAAKIPPQTPLVGWLYKVTHYACANLQRSERNRQRREKETAAMRPTTTPPAPASFDAQPLLDSALCALSQRERDVILLRYTQDLSLADIAQLTSVSHDTARKRLQRALQKLRRRFATSAIAGAVPLHMLTNPAPQAAMTQLASTVTATALSSSAASGTALSFLIAKGVSHMMFMVKLGQVAVIVAGISAATAVSGVLIAQTVNRAPAPPPVLLAAAPQPALPASQPSTTRPVPNRPPPARFGFIMGKVVDRDGKPAAGVWVYAPAGGTVNPNSPDLKRLFGTQVHSAMTSDNGEFLMREVSVGTTVVSAWNWDQLNPQEPRPGTQPRIGFFPSTVQVLDGQVTSLTADIKLGPTVKVSGRVLTPEGQPAVHVPNSANTVRVKFYVSLPAGGAMDFSGSEVTTNDKGEYHFTGIPIAPKVTLGAGMGPAYRGVSAQRILTNLTPKMENTEIKIEDIQVTPRPPDVVPGERGRSGRG